MGWSWWVFWGTTTFASLPKKAAPAPAGSRRPPGPVLGTEATSPALRCDLGCTLHVMAVHSMNVGSMNVGFQMRDFNGEYRGVDGISDIFIWLFNGIWIWDVFMEQTEGINCGKVWGFSPESLDSTEQRKIGIKANRNMTPNIMWWIGLSSMVAIDSWFSSDAVRCGSEVRYLWSVSILLG